MSHCLHVLVAWSVLLTQNRCFPATFFGSGPCNYFQTAADKLAAVIVDWTSSSAALWSREDANLSKGMRG